MANAISRHYIIPVLLPAAGTLSMSIIVFKNIFRPLPRTPPPHCYNWHTTTLTLNSTLLPGGYFIIGPTSTTGCREVIHYVILIATF